MNRFQHKIGLLIGLLLMLTTVQPAMAAPTMRTLHKALTQSSQAGLEFKVAFNNGRYEVYLRPTHTPEAPNLTLTAQVTLKVPHGADANQFTVANIVNGVAGAEWSATSRVNAPSEEPNADYISFTVAFPEGDHRAYNWAAGEAIQVFSFENSGPCLGPVSLIENNDAFMVEPNSANTNPGNQIDILGMGSDNLFLGAFDGAADCSDSARLPLPVFLPLVSGD
jgi:hypothetical protein